MPFSPPFCHYIPWILNLKKKNPESNLVDMLLEANSEVWFYKTNDGTWTTILTTA
jgi:hypothetical protein